jgi:hypothetical protein
MRSVRTPAAMLLAAGCAAPFAGSPLPEPAGIWSCDFDGHRLAQQVRGGAVKVTCPVCSVPPIGMSAPPSGSRGPGLHAGDAAVCLTAIRSGLIPNHTGGAVVVELEPAGSATYRLRRP